MTTHSGGELAARPLHPGSADGRMLLLSAPLSFWGGVAADGTVTDAGHPQRGARLAGRVVALSTVKGSSSSTSVLAEQLRAGIGPAAIVLARADPIVVVAALVAAELYDVWLPVVVVADVDYARLPRTGRVTVRADADSAVVIW